MSINDDEPVDSGQEPESDKKRDRKKDPIKERGLFWRTITYSWSFRGLVIVAMLFAMVSSFVGAASLLPMIPAIQFVLDPDQLQNQAENTEASVDEKSSEREEDLTVTPLEGLEVDFPFLRDTKDYLSLRKDQIRDAVYDFLLDKQEDAIKWIALLLILAVMIKGFFQYLSKYFITKVVFFSTQRLKVDLYDSCLNMDMARLTDHSSANLMSRLNSDVGKVRIIIQAVVTQSVLVPFEILFMLAFLFFISPEVTMITLIAMPVIVVPITIMSKYLRRLSKRDAEEDAYLMDVMQETIIGIQIVKAFNQEKYERKRFRHEAREQVRRQLKRTRLSLAGPLFTEVITTIATAAVLVAGAYIVLVEEKMQPAEFIVYLAALSRLYRPVKALSNTWMKLQRGLASAERVFEIMDTEPALTEDPDPVSLKPFHDSILFEDVSFRYDPEGLSILENLNLQIKCGQQVAIVGGTGSGKTTLSRLIPRFYDPENGRIIIDGIDIRRATLTSLRDQIALVTQDTILFDATVFENILYGDRSATRADVIDAAKAANAHEFIEGLQGGYDTPIGERGTKLSGGQRQRLTIARAILRNSPILILDEATSALDNNSQALVQEAVERLMKDRTVIVIAHRLSTIRNADMIVVLQDGKIVEQGTHDSLLATPNSHYSEYYASEEIASDANAIEEQSDLDSGRPSAFPDPA